MDLVAAHARNKQAKAELLKLLRERTGVTTGHFLCSYTPCEGVCRTIEGQVIGHMVEYIESVEGDWAKLVFITSHPIGGGVYLEMGPSGDIQVVTCESTDHELAHEALFEFLKASEP